MDWMNMTFAGLVTLGFVNVVLMFFPNLDSKIKVAVSMVFAFAALFVPADLGNMLLDKIKEAITIGLAVSGGYKLAQKAGGQ
jgi:hypothetical protein